MLVNLVKQQIKQVHQVVHSQAVLVAKNQQIQVNQVNQVNRRVRITRIGVEQKNYGKIFWN